MGSIVGGGIPGDPDGRLNGAHSMPPGPMRKVTGLLWAFKVEVVSVDAKDANPGRMVGTNVSVMVEEPIVAVTTVAPDGNGTFEAGDDD